MASSGTYAFAPSAGDLILNAFSLGCQLRRFELTQQHLEDAAFQANLQMVEFSNRNPNRWAMETVSVPLLQQTPTYTLDPRILAIVIAYVDTTNGGVTKSRVIGPLSANDYAALPVKLQPGPPTSFFFNLLTPAPTVSVWPVQTDTGTYTLKLQTFRQMQDVVGPRGVGLDSPYRFLDAFTKGMAFRLSTMYPPLKPNPSVNLEQQFEKAFALAAQRDQEGTDMYVRPNMSGYFR